MHLKCPLGHSSKPIFEQVRAFRQLAIGAVAQGGNWNPHGTHRVNFYESNVSGVDQGTGVTGNDPFVSSDVILNAMLVDLEPYGAISSQLFFDSLLLGVDGGYRIFCKRQSRMTARYINFSRNPANNMIAGIASVVWQTSFSIADGVIIDAFDSPTLAALKAALEYDDVLGLTVQFNCYRTVYYDDPTLSNGSPATTQAGRDLAVKLQGGGFQPNPARSDMVGVIGLWRKGEPIHEPGDRTLLPTPTTAVAAAHTRLSSTSITIDLSNCIPEIDRNLTKQDLGTLSIIALASQAGSDVLLGSLPYDEYNKTAYEASSGIVTVQLTPQQAQAAAAQDIAIRDGQGNTLLTEAALRVIPSSPNVYLDEGTNQKVTFQAYQRGIPANGPLPLSVYTMTADGGAIANTASMQADANGVLTMNIQGTSGGTIPYVVASPNDPPPSGGIDTQANTYMYTRTLAADAQIAALPATWPNVYSQVLANWNAMAPCMDNWLMLNDPLQVRKFAHIIKRLTDPANFEHYRYMPVTRDMTAGMRSLLYRFLDMPDDQLGTLDLTAPAQPVSKSRAMRRP